MIGNSAAAWMERIRRLHRDADPRLVALFYGVLVLKVGVLAVLLAVNPDVLITDDTSTYVKPARSLLRDGTFATEHGPMVLRTPGYPVFLLPFVAVFRDAYAPAVAVANFLLVGGIAGLTYGIVRRIIPHTHARTVAGLAFALVLIEPNLFLSEYAVATEIPFTFLLVLASYWLVRALDEEKVDLLLGAGLALTAAAFVRPIGLYLPYVLAAVGLLWFGIRGRWKQVLTVALVALLHFGLTTAWSLRNEARTGERLFTSISHVNLYEYVAASVKARANDRSWADTRREFREARESWPGNDARTAVMASDSALKVLRAHPVETVAVGAQGLATNIADPGTGSVANMFELREPDSGIIYKFVSMNPLEFGIYLLKNEKALALSIGVGLIWIAFMWGTFCIGIFKVRLRPFHWLLLGIIVYIMILGSGPQSMARFRVPATPFILAFSAAGSMWLSQKYGSGDTGVEGD